MRKATLKSFWICSKIQQKWRIWYHHHNMPCLGKTLQAHVTKSLTSCETFTTPPSNDQEVSCHTIAYHLSGFTPLADFGTAGFQSVEPSGDSKAVDFLKTRAARSPTYPSLATIPPTPREKTRWSLATRHTFFLNWIWKGACFNACGQPGHPPLRDFDAPWQLQL